MLKFITVIIAGCLVACGTLVAQPVRKPNVVLILADDLGYGDVGAYGQTRIKTPNIDRLAREGMRFTQFYAGSPVCAPSRATLFTGRHTGHNTIRGNGNVPLGAGDYTLSQMFRSVGYRVDGIGKWGLGLAGTSGEPRAKGFNQWVGFLDQQAAHNYYPDTIWRYDSVQDWNAPAQNHGRRYIHDVFTEAMGRSIQINADYQFFLYLPFTIPHANPALGKEGMQVPHDAPYSAEDWPQPEKNKAAMITRLDQSVGRLLARLEEQRLHRDTIIIFTSDNGPHDKGGVDPEFFKSSGPLRGLKRDLYEGGLRVPMIVWWPGRVEAGKVSDQVWAMWDLLPTLGEVAGARVPDGLDGISMLPTWVGGKQTNQHEQLYWEFHERGFQQAVRMADWKGLRLAPTEPLELYNLRSDPAEKKNVAAEHPGIVAKLEKIMKTERTESPDWPTDPAKLKDRPAAAREASPPGGPPAARPPAGP
jgi:arylsulfatase A-like enzyme